VQVDLGAALAQHFGFPGFRGQQEDVIRHVLGGGDALVVMATGEGKSLCYQLPALVQDGVSLVISPLIALMEDQVQALVARGIPAACIHSQMPAEQRQARLQSALAGEVKLLYVTPERFRVGDFAERMRAVRVPLLAIDEAHCVSHWGHDFRPDYSRLGDVREALGCPPTLALTATATPDVQRDILEVLRTPDATLFHTGIERPNLFMSVRELDHEEDKLARVLEVMETVGGPGIVYTALIKTLLQLEEALRRRGYAPLIYHGKLSASERHEQQRKFLASDDALILATNAFGMGVDKPDIRFILHYQVPRTLEAYYQEIGRAGRDGVGSFCELLYLEEDVAIQREFTEWANPDVRFMTQVIDYLAAAGERLQGLTVQDLRETFLVKNRRDGRVETCLNLLESAGCTTGELGYDFDWIRRPTDEEVRGWLPEDKRKRNLMGLLEMVRYARGTECRKDIVHRYFGFAEAGDCGACDVDTDAHPWLDRHLPAARRREIKAGVTVTDEEGLRRGDWIEVRGLGPCHVTRVHHGGKHTRIDVEVARDLTQRSLDLGRTRWRKVRR